MPLHLPRLAERRDLGHGAKTVALRTHLFWVASEQPASLGIAKEMVTAKFRNDRGMLHGNYPQPPAKVLDEIKGLTGMVVPADSIGILPGIEGAATFGVR